MPGEAEGLEPDGRAGVSSILLRKVPSAVPHSGVNVCFTVLAVLHDQCDSSLPLAAESLYPMSLHCPKQWDPSLLWDQALGWTESPGSELHITGGGRNVLMRALRDFGECSPLQKSLFPCLSLLSVWPWVPEQLPHYGLGK